MLSFGLCLSCLILGLEIMLVKLRDFFSPDYNSLLERCSFYSLLLQLKHKPKLNMGWIRTYFNRKRRITDANTTSPK
jgi:hypothetical protein